MVSFNSFTFILFVVFSLISFLASRSSMNIPEYQLKIGNQHGDANAISGILAYKSPPYVEGDELVQAIVIIKHIPDLADARSENPLQMTLLPDGTGVLVVEPAVSEFMKQPPPGLYADCHPDMRNAFTTAHNLTVTATSGAETESYILRFPDGIIGKMGGMNPPGNGRSLTGNVNVTTTSIQNNKNGRVIPFTHVTMRFAVLLESKEPQLIRRKQTKTMNDIDDLLQGMSNLMHD